MIAELKKLEEENIVSSMRCSVEMSELFDIEYNDWNAAINLWL